MRGRLGVSSVATVAALTLVAVALVIIVGVLASNYVSSSSKTFKLSVAGASLVRAYQNVYLLTVSLRNEGSEPLNVVTSVTLRGAGNPSCSLQHTKGLNPVKPGEGLELTYRCSPVTLGEKYRLEIGTVEGVRAWALVTATG